MKRIYLGDEEAKLMIDSLRVTISEFNQKLEEAKKIDYSYNSTLYCTMLRCAKL